MTKKRKKKKKKKKLILRAHQDRTRFLKNKKHVSQLFQTKVGYLLVMGEEWSWFHAGALRQSRGHGHNALVVAQLSSSTDRIATYFAIYMYDLRKCPVLILLSWIYYFMVILCKPLDYHKLLWRCWPPSKSS